MSFTVDNPILNNPFEEPKEYWIYDEGQPRRMPGRRPAGYYFRTGKSQNGQIGLFAEEQFKTLELVNIIARGLKSGVMADIKALQGLLRDCFNIGIHRIESGNCFSACGR